MVTGGVTGGPPTAAADTNTTQVATTAFVIVMCGASVLVGSGAAIWITKSTNRLLVDTATGLAAGVSSTVGVTRSR